VTDSAAAEQAAESWSRRALVGAGVVGAVLVAGQALPAAAATPLSDEDTFRARFVIGVELAARDLYQAAIDAGAEGTAWGILVTQHASYAQRVAGITGISADRRDEGVYGDREANFTGSSPANAAFALENELAATHANLLTLITDVRIADALASIASAEAHHAAYLAERSGRGDNFDALFINSASPIVPAVTS
jgi:hypothetical protein